MGATYLTVADEDIFDSSDWSSSEDEEEISESKMYNPEVNNE